MKILLIEDDVEISDFVFQCLVSDIFTVDRAYTGIEGSYMARTNSYDVIIADYSLPGKNGPMVLDEIRNAGIQAPIIFLTVHDELTKKIEVFEHGADDYMTKPFSYDELKARIQALARRPHVITDTILTKEDISLDTKKQLVHRGKTKIYLTRKEFNLLEFLLRNKGTVLSRGLIMEYVWNAESDPFSNTIESHILNLRKKIRDDKKKTLIRNIPGRGYIIDA